jgi:hypothetical protein
MYTELSRKWVTSVLDCIDKLQAFEEWGREVLPHRDEDGEERQPEIESLLGVTQQSMILEYEEEVERAEGLHIEWRHEVIGATKIFEAVRDRANIQREARNMIESGMSEHMDVQQQLYLLLHGISRAAHGGLSDASVPRAHLRIEDLKVKISRGEGGESDRVDDPAADFNVKVSAFNGSFEEITVRGCMKVWELKKRLGVAFGVPPDMQIIQVGARILQVRF